MPSATENTISRVQMRLHDEFPNARMEFAVQIFPNHAELWVYVLEMAEYDRVRARCGEMSEEMGLERSEPEIWLLAKTWTGPWPGGQSEQELRKRRDEFKLKHGLKL